jgi:ABC-type phosphate transport system permease subunit
MGVGIPKGLGTGAMRACATFFGFTAVFVGRGAMGTARGRLHLRALLWQGLSGLSLKVFTAMTPPPASDGGLLNPIAGCLIMTGLAVLIGTPVGILSGTYWPWP